MVGQRFLAPLIGVRVPAGQLIQAEFGFRGAFRKRFAKAVYSDLKNKTDIIYNMMYFHGDRSKNEITITFDDGPSE